MLQGVLVNRALELLFEQTEAEEKKKSSIIKLLPII